MAMGQGGRNVHMSKIPYKAGVMEMTCREKLKALGEILDSVSI